MDPTLQQYGLAGFVIFVLGGVVGLLYRENLGLRKKYDDLQEKRLQEAVSTRDNLLEPLNQQARLSEKIYDLLLNASSKRGA